MVGTGVGPTPAEEREIRALIRLRGAPGLGDRGVFRLVESSGSGVAALRAHGCQGDLLDDPDGPIPLSAWVQEGMEILPLTSPRYPDRLRDLTDPPPVLFLKGNLELLHRPAVAMVGVRRATGVGRRAAETMGRALARAGVTVVSGLALGIDGAAHRGGLLGPGSTMAVLGSGFRSIYPASHRTLFQEIGKGGLLVTEFLPDEKAMPHHFPKRNRIIAALASAVVVVEAGQKSGALITVDHALDLGRDVYAVPGSVENPQARGTNRLLREGARVLAHPEKVVDDLLEGGAIPPPPRLGGREGEPEGLGVPSELEGLWDVLSTEPMSTEEVAAQTELSLAQALAGLSALELGGWARRCPGMRFRRV